MQPHIYLHRTEGRSGTITACFYFEAGKELYGWRLGGRGHRFAASFFMLENFYANDKAYLYRSLEDDVYGPWTIDYPRRYEEIRCPLPEAVQHELERIQSLFVEEWLFFENDPDAAEEIVAYERHGIALHAVNIKQRKLNRGGRSHGRWEYRTPGCDIHVVEYLRRNMGFNDIVIEKWREPESPRAAYRE